MCVCVRACVLLLIVCDGVWSAVLSSAERGTRDAVRAEKGGAEESVADDGVWVISGMLVRAYKSHYLLAHLQEPPGLGVHLQVGYAQPVRDLTHYTRKHVHTRAHRWHIHTHTTKRVRP